jgi:tetratricopeptide (TPR) repeat protein
MQSAFRLSVCLLLAAPAIQAEPGARWQSARVAPESGATSGPRSEIMLVPSGARDTRLAAAHHAYSLWTQQLQAAVVTPGQSEDWRGFLGMEVGLGEAYKQMGEAAYNDNKFSEAAELFSVAHDFLPNDLDLLQKLGFSLKSAGRYEESLARLEAAKTTLSSDPQLWLWIGDAQRLLGDYPAAVSSYNTARDMADPKDAEAYQEYITYTELLAATEPSWEAFETHRGFANRHQETGRVRRMLAEFVHALRVAPEIGEDETDADFRRGWVNLALAEQHNFLKEIPVAYDYFTAGLALYERGASQTDIMRALQGLAVCCHRLAELYPREKDAWYAKAAGHWEAAAKVAQGVGDTEYLRYLNGGLLYAYAQSRPLDAPEVVELRERLSKEIPWRGPINDFSLAAAAEGEIACRMREGDLAGARLLLDMTGPYYKDTGFLVDLEQNAKALASTAAIYLEQEHFDKAMETAAQGMDQITGLRRYLDGDGFNRSGNPAVLAQLAAIQAAAAVGKEDFSLALDFAESYQLVRRHDLFASRVREENWRNDFTTERELITAREPLLAKALADAEAVGDADAAAWYAARIEEDGKRFAVLGHVDRLAPGASLSYAGTQRRGPTEIIAALPAGTGVLYWMAGPRGGVAVWATNAGAGGVALPEASTDAVEAAVVAFEDAWTSKDNAAVQAALGQAQALLAAPLEGRLPEASHWLIAVNPIIGALPVTALLSNTPYASRIYGASAYLTVRALGGSPVNAITPATPADQGALQAALSAGASLLPAEADFTDTESTLGVLRFGTAPEAVLLTGEALALNASGPLAAFNLEIKLPTRGLPGEHAGALAESLSVAGTRATLLNGRPVDATLRTAFYDAFSAAIAQGPAAAMQAGRDAVRAAAPESLAWTAFEYYGVLQ